MKMRVVASRLNNDAEISGEQHGAQASSMPMQTEPDEGNDVFFERFCAALKAHVGADIYASWFGRLKLHTASKSVLRFSVPTAFLKSWINNHYIDLMTDLAQSERPHVLKVEVLVRSATRSPRPQPVAEKPKAAASERPASSIRPASRAQAANQPLMPEPESPTPRPAGGGATTVFGSPLDPYFTFDSFVMGASNRVALAAAQAVVESGSAAVRFNPLFIHSSVGLGKTHLLQAIANAAINAPEQPRVVYLTAEYFMWKFASAIRDNDALTLKDSLRNIDLLVIDDMQFLQGKMIQHEFCHLLNTLLDSAKQVVVAADRAPWELESLDPRVRSRLTGGVSLEIEAPDYQMRLEMLKRRLSQAQLDDPSIDIPAEVLEHVASKVTASGRELEGAFNQLLFRRSFEPDLSIERVDELLVHLVGTGEPKRVRIEDIQRVVARHYCVTRQELVSNRRTRVIVKPRQIAMFLAKTMTPRSFPEIGRRFGGRDHTTVLHAVRKIEDLLDQDSKLSQEVELLKRLINE